MRYADCCALLEAIIDYLYYHIKIEVLCDRLNISRSTFTRHEKVLAVRLLRYLIRNNIVEKIQEDFKRSSVYIAD